ncbi:MAG: LCP family protein [Ilumatobacteraceae bacterium]
MTTPPTGPDWQSLPPPAPGSPTADLAPPTHDETSDVESANKNRGPTRAVIMALVLPGAPSFLRRRLVSWLLLFTGVLVPVAAVVVGYVRRDRITSLVLDTTILLIVQIVCALFVVSRLVSVMEVISSRRPGTSKRLASFVAVVGTLVVAFPAGFSVVRADQLTDVINDVFVNSGGSEPLAFIGTNTVDEGDEFHNILLLGGDEGPGRWALRTDTMILVSVHRESGRIAMVSIPRNLRGLEFPDGSPMHDEFPRGFDDLTNAVYPYVYAHPDIAAQYLRGALAPEAVALATGIAHSMQVTIHDYVLVNMQGFLDLIDALGGVTVTLDKRIPMPGNVPGAKYRYPDLIGPGEVDLDGTLALGYVRSRAADSDYSRMGRQRHLLEQLAAQTTGSEVLLKFPDLARVMRDSVRTSLSTDEFAFLADRLRSGVNIQESVGLAPPLINPGNPDWGDIASLIDALQEAIRTGVDFPFA